MARYHWLQSACHYSVFCNEPILLPTFSRERVNIYVLFWTVSKWPATIVNIGDFWTTWTLSSFNSTPPTCNKTKKLKAQWQAQGHCLSHQPRAWEKANSTPAPARNRQRTCLPAAHQQRQGSHSGDATSRVAHHSESERSAVQVMTKENLKVAK